MERPKYDQRSSVPAVESSSRSPEVDIPQVDVPTSPSQKEPDPPAPIELEGDAGDGTEVDENDLQVMQDEGGKNGSVRYTAEPAPPAAQSERKH